MILEVNGVPYDFFTDAQVSIRLDALSRQFSFGATAVAGTLLPFRGGEACRVLDGDDVMLTGYIERLDVDYGTTRHTIAVSGRDKCGDVVDSALTATGDFQPPITLKRVIQKGLADIGARITVIDNAGTESFKKASDLVAPEPGQNAFEFIEALARKRQVLLTSNGDGDLVLTRAATTRSTGALQNKVGAEDNNIIASSSSYDGTGRFKTYTILAQPGPLPTFSAGDIGTGGTNQSASFTDDGKDVRDGRQWASQPETAMVRTDALARAKWEANLRKARGRLYSATVQGFRTYPGGPLWEVNTVVPVVDDFAGIGGEMLISGVSFALDEQQGSTTTLTLVPTNAYTLQLNEPETDKVGDGFIN
jgi:prophage tail gpP-like protein